MELRDLFVAIVALTVGGLMLYSSIVNQGRFLQMTVARVLDQSKRRVPARATVGSVGALLLLIGLYLILSQRFK